MKSLLFSLVVSLLFISACTPSRYLLTDKGKEKKYLLHYIQEQQKKGKLEKHPLVIVNGMAYRYAQELVEKRLPVASTDIREIVLLPKNSEAGVTIYGEDALEGVLLIITKREPKRATEMPDPSRLLFLVNGKPTPFEVVEQLDRDQIASLDVIKGKEAVKRYTAIEGDWEGVIIITLKEK